MTSRDRLIQPKALIRRERKTLCGKCQHQAIPRWSLGCAVTTEALPIGARYYHDAVLRFTAPEWWRHPCQQNIFLLVGAERHIPYVRYRKFIAEPGLKHVRVKTFFANNLKMREFHCGNYLYAAQLSLCDAFGGL